MKTIKLIKLAGYKARLMTRDSGYIVSITRPNEVNVYLSKFFKSQDLAERFIIFELRREIQSQLVELGSIETLPTNNG
jgi:hypothetical protein